MFIDFQIFAAFFLQILIYFSVQFVLLILIKFELFVAKGRTNTELREKFILSDNVVGQGMSSFTTRPSASSRLSGGTRSGSTTPVCFIFSLQLFLTTKY